MSIIKFLLTNNENALQFECSLIFCREGGEGGIEEVPNFNMITLWRIKTTIVVVKNR